MLEMMQVIIWLGCAIVVLLGIIALQIGLASPNPRKGELLAVGYGAILLALIVAVICFGVSETLVANFDSGLAI